MVSQFNLKVNSAMDQAPAQPQVPVEPAATLTPATPTDEIIQAFIINIKSGSIEKMKQMLENYRQNISNKLDSQLRQPPLYFASINSNQQLSFEMVKMLVEAGGNPNFKDANQQTIMFYACRDGKINLVKYLLDNGCKLDEEDLYGQTPIFYVASQNQLELLQFFTPEMVKHVDKLAKQTPLYYSARKGHLEMCKQLVSRGCDVSHHDSNNKTAVQYAKKSKFQEVAEYLQNQIKKSKEMSKVQNLNVQQQSHTQNQGQKQKKKREAMQINTNKNTYKISFFKENGEIHDLSEEEARLLFKDNSLLEKYFTTPETISQEELQTTLEDTWQKVATKVLNQCWKLKTSHWFHEPVQPLKFGINDYFDIIQHPMDLGTIKKKLNYNAYQSAKQFANDMSLVWKNSYRYNGQAHEVSVCARQVEKTFEEAIRSAGFTKYLQE